ncbi:hypothetical protein IJI18_03030 [Candidatus Saccharibacteria bacterium]|nr:hypothetical protein [Candidatus Saccharibacteria bacterium]
MNKSDTDDSGNLNTTTESICPKGWTLPTAKQIGTIGPSGGSSTYVTGFNPVLGGFYHSGTLYDEDAHGFWWGSTAQNTGARRDSLYYNGSNLYIGGYFRRSGYYIRCVSEEKTVTDLTYLQDMTGGIVDNR